MRGKMVAAGVVLSALWLTCWAATVVPGSPAVWMQWVAGNLLAFLAGGAFAVAVRVRPGAESGAATDRADGNGSKTNSASR